MSTRWPVLVSPAALAAMSGDAGLVVFDARGSLADHSAGDRAYTDGHVPGARRADMERDLSGPHAPGAGRHPWPDAATFAAWLARQGVAPGTRVVAYDDGDGAYASRLWALLRLGGHRDVAVLDGGWADWTAAGFPVSRDVPSPAPLPPAPLQFDRARLFDAAAAAAHVADGGLLLDARAAPRFRGEVEPIDRVAGHVPGARNRAYVDNLDGGRFKDAAVLRAEFDALLDGRAPSALVAMCGSGVTACHHLLAMAHAGRDGAGLYAGSWSGWIEDPARPVATGNA